MAIEGITEAEVVALVRTIEEATTAFLRGDMARYLGMTSHLPGLHAVQSVRGRG